MELRSALCTIGIHSGTWKSRQQHAYINMIPGYPEEVFRCKVCNTIFHRRKYTHEVLFIKKLNEAGYVRHDSQFNIDYFLRFNNFQYSKDMETEKNETNKKNH